MSGRRLGRLLVMTLASLALVAGLVPVSGDALLDYEWRVSPISQVVLR